MNLLKIAEAKKTKLESLSQVKLNAVKSIDGVVVISDNGVIVSENEIIKFENDTVFVTGKFASATAFQAAIRQNKI